MYRVDCDDVGEMEEDDNDADDGVDDADAIKGKARVGIVWVFGA